MKLTSVFQIILIFFVILISGIFYYNFFVSNQTSLNSLEDINEKKIEEIIQKIELHAGTYNLEAWL